MKVSNWVILNLILSVVILLFGSMMYWVGFHNNDMGHNMKWFECAYNTSLVDNAHDMFTGEVVVLTASEAISGGSFMRDSGVTIMLAGMFIFALNIGGLLSGSDARGKDKRTRKKKKGKDKGK